MEICRTQCQRIIFQFVPGPRERLPFRVRPKVNIICTRDKELEKNESTKEKTATSTKWMESNEQMQNENKASDVRCVYGGVDISTYSVHVHTHVVIFMSRASYYTIAAGSLLDATMYSTAGNTSNEIACETLNRILARTMCLRFGFVWIYLEATSQKLNGKPPCQNCVVVKLWGRKR